MRQVFVNISKGMIEVHDGDKTILFNGDENGAEKFNLRMDAFLDDGGSYICSSSVDYPEDYGVSRAIVEKMFVDL